MHTKSVLGERAGGGKGVWDVRKLVYKNSIKVQTQNNVDLKLEIFNRAHLRFSEGYLILPIFLFFKSIIFFIIFFI